ncbi:hypothetical protein IWZ03DRAFT_407275 [Phyllosticta citriasiana]|uniref:Major facilitator superfamily (MFS) profile domain-containing protein n=1 Tax=Phyllosticta citriasiana TaxID=595635 RepID=A0ABR1KKZ4_9PEZI
MEPDRVLFDKEIRVPDFVGEDVSYGPGGFHGLIGSPFVCGAAFLASLGGFSFGYDQGVISVINVMPQFKAKYPEIESGFYKGLMTAMLELGAFLGSIMVEVEFQARMLEKRHPGARGFKLELLTWTDLFKKRIWRRTAVGMGVAFFQQFSGINGFIYYAPTLFASLARRCHNLLLYHRQGRPSAPCCLGRRRNDIVMSALVGLYSDDWAANKAAGWATTAMAYLYILLYGVSYSPLGWALPSEVFNNSTRAKGVALSTATVWISNFIIGVIVPTMIEEAGFGTYVFFAIMCMLAAVWAFLLVRETKGKTLEQIDEVFGDASGAEEREVMREVALSGGARRAKDMLTAGKVVDLRDETTV